MSSKCTAALLAVIVVALTAAGLAAADRRRVGEIDFFGSKGVDLAAIRAALPLREGDSFPPPKFSSASLKKEVNAIVTRVTGRAPTDIAFVCCDAKQSYMVYIGLAGESYEALTFNPAPTGSVRLPKDAVKLRNNLDDAMMHAIMKGNGNEDDSAGYTLPDDPKARQAALAVRDYALQHEDLVFEVVSSSADADHRAIAAQMLGYGRQSDAQVDALVHASLDLDDDVRNDAVRALWILVSAKPTLGRRIAPEPFIGLMRSGAWSDHNKASLALMAMTEARDPQVLAQLRQQALDPLLEMGRWRNIGHAEAALTVLGRIAGIDEDELNKLIDAGQAATILAKFER